MKVLHILLAEDNKGDVFLVRESLQEHQIEHELHVVENGQEALDYLVRIGKLDEAPCPDLMLLDLNLPKGDGHSVLTEFRKHPECEHMPVVVVTSSDSPKDRDRMAKLGIRYYFRKPTDYEAFMQLGGIVKEVLEKQVA
jgi:CheY-like chemotaxis protein